MYIPILKMNLSPNKSIQKMSDDTRNFADKITSQILTLEEQRSSFKKKCVDLENIVQNRNETIL